jgi:hypothetical protein
LSIERLVELSFELVVRGVEGGRVLWWQVELEGCRRVRFVCAVCECLCVQCRCDRAGERCRGAPLSSDVSLPFLES